MDHDDLMEIVRGFQTSRILLTAIELDLFSAVAQGGTATAIAASLGTDPRATEMLLNALVSLKLLTKRDGTFQNGALAARYLVEGSLESERLALIHTVNLWTRWTNLTAAVRAGSAVDYREVGARGENWIRSFIAAMHRHAGERAPYVVSAVGAERVRRLLDVGGGSGAYSIAFALANESLEAEILDLPEVLPIAQENIEDAGLSARVRARAGDLRAGKLGEDYDMILLSSICHMLGPQENLDLFRRAYDALAPSGRIVVQDFILEADKTSPPEGAVFALNMLVSTNSGSSYSEQEYQAWLGQAGFKDIRRLRLPGPTGLMVGVRG